jgi:putative endonuclease
LVATPVGLRQYQQGIAAEHQAVQFLTAKGWQIIQQRCRTPYGELDIVAQTGNTLVAVEVKQRKSLELAAYSLSAAQQQRLSDALLCLMADYPHLTECRIDYIGISGGQLVHLENVVESS